MAMVGVESCWWEAELDSQGRLSLGEFRWLSGAAGLVAAALEVRVSSEVERRRDAFLVE